MGYFYDGGNPPEDKPELEGYTKVESSYSIEERLWDAIGENTALKQENYYLRTKLAQIQTILDEYKAYSAK